MDLPPCADDYVNFYDVPKALIQAVAEVEGGWQHAFVGPDSRGHYTMGLLQVNTLWFDHEFGKTLRQYGITKDMVIADNCTNIATATWIIRKKFDTHGDWAKSLAAYHAGPDRLEEGTYFVNQIYKALNKRR